MVKDALEYIVGMKKPNITEIGGQTYSDKKLERISYEPHIEPFKLSTLDSLIKYIKSDLEVPVTPFFLHIVSEKSVKMLSTLDSDKHRECLAVVDAEVPRFEFGAYIPQENFCINLKTKFIQNEDRELLVSFAGNVEDKTVAEYGDDGISQKATVKTGVASKTETIVPSPVHLKPYRTFDEIDQPESDFIFRIKSDKFSGITCALFSADGGAWKTEAKQSIKEYLSNELSDLIEKGKIIILA